MSVPVRSYPADEITRDPIFLLQRRHLVISDPAAFDAIEEISEDGDLSREEAESLVSRDLAAWSYDTRSVWFTRQEAERAGERRSHNFPHGWRVYCVCAEGDLSKLLERYTQTRHEAKGAAR